MSHGIPAARYAQRIETVRKRLPEMGATALLCGPGADLEWLTGYDIHPTERLTMLVVLAEGEPVLVVPRLELEIANRAPALAGGAVTARSWGETQDALDLVAAALPAPRPDRLLVSDTLWASFVLRIQHTFSGASLEPASGLLAPLRAVKDREEVELLREAAHAADRVVGAITSGRLVGRTERDISREVRERLVDEGHDLPAFWTVASGENTAAPHHSDSDRAVRAGEPLLLDIGGRLGGYSSDITRTLWVAGADGAGPAEEFRRLYSVVEDAQVAGRAAARPGVPCEAVDAAARAVIESAGYGECFIHRTGHGIGLEVHESPYLVAGNGELLAPGHAFSVEPGIYLQGRYGARIEDIAVCTDDGPDTLNEAPRELLTVRGT